MSFRSPGFVQAATVLLLLSCPLAANSPDEDRSAVNFSYAVFFGTGVYEVKEQKAFVFRAPLSYRIREPSREQAGIELMLPVLVGFYDYATDSVLDGQAPGDAATLSFVPGLAFEYLITDRWRLKPFGQVGIGRDLENNENALIYLAGVNSHYRIPTKGKWQFALGNTVTYAGFDPDDGARQSLGILGAGIDMTFPWDLKFSNEETNFASSLIYYFYADNPSFEQGDDRAKDVKGEFELSLAVSFRKPPKVLGIEFDRIGLGFRYGDNVRGLRLVTKFPF